MSNYQNSLEHPGFRISWKDAKEFVDWVRSKAFCNSGQHICDRLVTQLENAIKDVENFKEPPRHQDFGGF